MFYEDNGHAGRYILHKARHPRYLIANQAGGRFIKKEQLRISGKPDPNVEYPLLSMGKVLGRQVFLFAEPDQGEDLTTLVSSPSFLPRAFKNL